MLYSLCIFRKDIKQSFPYLIAIHQKKAVAGVAAAAFTRRTHGRKNSSRLSADFVIERAFAIDDCCLPHHVQNGKESAIPKDRWHQNEKKRPAIYTGLLFLADHVLFMDLFVRTDINTLSCLRNG